MNCSNYPEMDGLQIAHSVRKGEISCVEVIECAIARIEELNPSINAVIYRMYEDARKIARNPRTGSPFAGVPMLLKDLAAGACAGTPCTMGSALLANNISDFDSEVVGRYKAAGAIILGKTNLPNFGTNATTEPRSFGPTKNPWDLTRSAGGSSGGAAAAVASGMVPIAHGTDAAGSLRVPASHCGVFTMKPTRGRISAGPESPEFVGGLGTVHVLTRSVRDSAAMLDATAGYADGDPHLIRKPNESFLSSVSQKPRPLRIAFSTAAPNNVSVDEECIAAVQAAAKLCEDLGHHVEENAPVFDFEEMSKAFALLHAPHWGGLATTLMDKLGREPAPEEIEPSVVAWAKLGINCSAIQYVKAQRDMYQIAKGISHFFKRYDVFVSPCAAQPPVALGVIDASDHDFERFLKRMWSHMAFTAQFNCTGQPAMSVPLHLTHDGLPVGVQFVARLGEEVTLFSLAGQLETARPWRSRRPQLETGLSKKR